MCIFPLSPPPSLQREAHCPLLFRKPFPHSFSSFRSNQLKRAAANQPWPPRANASPIITMVGVQKKEKENADKDKRPSLPHCAVFFFGWPLSLFLVACLPRVRKGKFIFNRREWRDGSRRAMRERKRRGKRQEKGGRVRVFSLLSAYALVPPFSPNYIPVSYFIALRKA